MLNHNPPSGRDFRAGEGGEYVQQQPPRKKLRFEQAWFWKTAGTCPRAWFLHSNTDSQSLKRSVTVSGSTSSPFFLRWGDSYWLSFVRTSCSVQQYFCILWGKKPDTILILLRLNLKWHRHTASCKCSTTLVRYTARTEATHTYVKPGLSNVKRRLQSTW